VNKSPTSIPHIELIPIRDILDHEHHDDSRTGPLISRLQQSGLLRNPPIVTPLKDGSLRYMILDGANRVAALRLMDFKYIPAQVVAPDDPGLKLYNWNHVIWNFDSQEMLLGLERLENISILHGSLKDPLDCRGQGLAKFENNTGDLFTICTAAEDLETRVSQLNAMVDIYKEQGSLDRTNEWSVVRLQSSYKTLCGLVIFPKLEIRQVLFLAGKNSLLPAGITRFTVSPRALHLNFPLEAMAGDGTLQEKNARLQEFLYERIAQKGVRYYAEATYLFDE
jgi:hypothetical protein